MFDNDFEALNFPNKWRYLNYYTKGAYWSQKFVYTYIGKPDIWWLPAKNLAKDSILVNTHFPRIFGPFGNDISTFMMSERGLTYRYADGPAAGRLEPTVLLGRILNGSFFYDTFTQFNFKFIFDQFLNHFPSPQCKLKFHLLRIFLRNSVKNPFHFFAIDFWLGPWSRFGF